MTHLAVTDKVSASTQNQALSSLLFLYQKVLGLDLGRLDAVRAKRPERLPVVLSVDEVRTVLDRIGGGVYRLLADLLYGSGLRLLEACRLRGRAYPLTPAPSSATTAASYHPADLRSV